MFMWSFSYWVAVVALSLPPEICKVLLFGSQRKLWRKLQLVIIGGDYKVLGITKSIGYPARKRHSLGGGLPAQTAHPFTQVS